MGELDKFYELVLNLISASDEITISEVLYNAHTKAMNTRYTKADKALDDHYIALLNERDVLLKRVKTMEAYVKRLERDIPENNLALAKASLRAEAAELVAEAGNGLFQLGIRHSENCDAIKAYGDGYCGCGRDETVSKFVAAWGNWQRTLSSGAK